VHEAESNGKFSWGAGGRKSDDPLSGIITIMNEKKMGICYGTE
jgi:hypothetical protein